MRSRAAPAVLWALAAASLTGCALLSGCADRAEAGPGAAANRIESNAAELFVPEPQGERRTYLASVVGIALGPHEYVDGFRIDTWDVDFLAVCRLPPGWRIRAGRMASPDGVLAGEASHGVTFLDRMRLSELDDLALVRVLDPVQPEEIRSAGGIQPATFSGRATIGTYGDGEPRREQRLGAANIRLLPAARCPDPRD